MRSNFFQVATIFLSLLPIHGFLLPRNPDISTSLQYSPQLQNSFFPNSQPTSDKLGHTVREQNDSICNAGVKQWSGLVDVSEEKKLFFWFFESRDDPENDPVIIWLNGGPGGTSMFGLFKEIGPCLVSEDDPNTTEFNPHSWSNFANVLYIDQPAGVGFSTVNNGSLGGPSTLQEAAIDFEKLLVTIFTEIFPQFSKQPLHIAGESFGGHYVPFFTQYILTGQKMQALHSLSTLIKSIILVDADVDPITSGTGGQYDHFCTRDANGNLREGAFNETACTAMEADTPACERLVQNCISSYDRNLCAYADEFCTKTLGKWFASDVIPGGRDPYDDRKKCGSNPPLCEDFLEGPLTVYLNQKHVQEALGFEGFNFSGINFDINGRFERSGDTTIPTTREMVYVLDESEVGVLVLNGNNDAIVNTEGQIRVYDSLPWSKQALFRIQPWRDWAFPRNNEDEDKVKVEKGGRVKKAGKLSFLTVDNAGHTSPGDAPESVAFVVECWTRGKGSEEVNCP